ncbi:MAG: 3-dehydroquinate synthase, partial [Betaproteobacteria bacterium]
KDIRALLNLGHTFGHAIETEMGYGAWFHGEAVAAGTVLAAQFSRDEWGGADIDLPSIERLLTSLNLPTKAPKVAAQKLLAHMQRDKKNEDGVVTLILLKRIGEAYVDRRVPGAKLLAFLERAVA